MLKLCIDNNMLFMAYTDILRTYIIGICKRYIYRLQVPFSNFIY